MKATMTKKPRVDISEIDFSKPRVRYKGRVQDKCDISY